MARRRWVISGVGLATTGGLAVAATLFGLQGVEVASWVAAVAGVAIGIAAIVLAGPSRTADSAPGPRSIQTSGDISGIASTGDDAVNIQHR